MAKGIRVEHDFAGYRRVMRSAEVAMVIDAAVQGMGRAANSVAGDTDAVFVADTQLGRNRAIGMVKTGNHAAAKLNSDNNLLIKVLRSGAKRK